MCLTIVVTTDVNSSVILL